MIQFECLTEITAGDTAVRTWEKYPPIFDSRPSDHYFRSVCLFVCLSVCLFFSAVFDPISIKLGHTLYVWVYLCPLEYRGCATPGGWVTPKNLYF